MDGKVVSKWSKTETASHTHSEARDVSWRTTREFIWIECVSVSGPETELNLKKFLLLCFIDCDYRNAFLADGPHLKLVSVFIVENLKTNVFRFGNFFFRDCFLCLSSIVDTAKKNYNRRSLWDCGILSEEWRLGSVCWIRKKISAETCDLTYLCHVSYWAKLQQIFLFNLFL